jgi:hypothetical protein
VAQAVVELLEVVDVDEADAQRRGVALDLGALDLEGRLQPAAVVHDA